MINEHNALPPAGSGELVPLRDPREGPLAAAHRAAHSGSGYQEPAGAGGLLEYWHILLHRKWMILTIAFLGGVLGSLAVIPQPSIYLAKTTVEVQGMNESFMNLNQVDPQAGTGSYAPTEANIQTQIQIIESAFMRRRVLERLGREVIPQAIPQSSVLDRLRMDLRVLPNDPMDFTRDAISTCATSVKAGPLKGSRVVEIRCESTVPEIAANYLNVLAGEYMEEALDSRVKNAQRIGKWVGERLEQAKAKLEESENQLQAYVRTSGLSSSEQIESLADTKLKQLQAELSSIQADRINKQTRNEMAKTAPPETLPDVIDDTRLREYQTRITDLQRQKSELAVTLGPEHFKVLRVDAQINQLQAALTKEVSNVLRRIQNDYETALKREKLLSAAHAAQSRVVAAQSAKNNDYNLLKRAVETDRQLYQALLQQVNQAGVAAAVPTSTVRVLDEAVPINRPYRPIWYMYTSLGLMSGLIAGCGLAFFRERLDSSVRAPGEASVLLQVPELGVIPSTTFGAGTAKRWGRMKRYGGAAEGNGRQARVELKTWLDKPSLLAESCRATIGSVVFGDARGYRPKVMVITSPHQREGKTTISANLAVAMAEVHGRVLLIDGDLRKPRLHKIFSLAQEPGLVDLVQDATPVAEYTPTQLGQPTEVPGLCVLPSGVAPPGAGNIFYASRFQELMVHARREFDAVLIDTPPLLLFADTRTVARLADGVILVLRSGVTDQESAMRAQRMLDDDETPLLGTILNDWTPKGSHSRYYDSYSRYYAMSKNWRKG